MRNTYDSKNPFNKGVGNQNQQSKQRQTYNSVQVNPKQMSFQKQVQANSTATLNKQNMQKFIVQTLKKLSIKNEDRIGLITSLKMNQKTLLSTISNLLFSFDGKFEEKYLNTEVIPELFKTLGYPSNINKTFFQPVGAPHTWLQCLTIMNWLAQLAVFHYEIRSHLQQGQFQDDFTTMLIKAFLSESPQIPEKYLQEEISKKQQSIDMIRYSLKTHSLEIQNLKAAQKDLSYMQSQQRRLESILNRQKQEVIQVDQQNSQILRKIEQLDAKIEQEKKMSQINERQINTLKNQIQNQELSVEQVQKIRYQIKEYQDKITELKKSYQKQKQNLDKIDGNIMNQYANFSSTLDTLKQIIKSCRFQIQRRNVYFQIPECNLAQFEFFLKDRKADCTETKVQQILGTKQIKQIKDKAQVLLSLINVELRNLQSTKDEITQQNKQLNQECLNNELKTNELKQNSQIMKNKLNDKKKENFDIQTRTKRLVSQISILEERVTQKLNEQQNSLQKLDILKQETREAIQFKRLYAEKTKQSIQRKKIKLQECQIQSLTSMEQYYISFVQLNQLVDQAQYVQEKFSQQQEGRKSLNRRQSIRFFNQKHNSKQEEKQTNPEQQSNKNIQISRRRKSQEQQFDIQRVINQKQEYFMSPPKHRVNRMKNEKQDKKVEDFKKN